MSQTKTTIFPLECAAECEKHSASRTHLNLQRFTHVHIYTPLPLMSSWTSFFNFFLKRQSIKVKVPEHPPPPHYRHLEPFSLRLQCVFYWSKGPLFGLLLSWGCCSGVVQAQPPQKAAQQELWFSDWTKCKVVWKPNDEPNNEEKKIEFKMSFFVVFFPIQLNNNNNNNHNDIIFSFKHFPYCL